MKFPRKKSKHLQKVYGSLCETTRIKAIFKNRATKRIYMRRTCECGDFFTLPLVCFFDAGFRQGYIGRFCKFCAKEEMFLADQAYQDYYNSIAWSNTWSY